MKAIRENTGLGLRESKELTAHCPSVVREGLAKGEAEKIKRYLEKAGRKSP